MTARRTTVALALLAVLFATLGGCGADARGEPVAVRAPRPLAPSQLVRFVSEGRQAFHSDELRVARSGRAMVVRRRPGKPVRHRRLMVGPRLFARLRTQLGNVNFAALARERRTDFPPDQDPIRYAIVYRDRLARFNGSDVPAQLRAVLATLVEVRDRAWDDFYD